MKRILLIITFSAFLFLALIKFEQLLGLLARLLSILAPFLIGFCIAFVLNLILSLLERVWDRLWHKQKGHLHRKLRRPICLLLSVLVFLGVIFAVFFILIPQLKRTGAMFIEMLPDYIEQIETWWQNISSFFAKHDIVLPAVDLNPEEIISTLGNFFAEKGHTFVDKTLDITRSIFSVVVNIVLAFVFAIYLLAQKETLRAQVKRLIFATLPEARATRLMEIVSLTNQTFSSFVTGQLTEAIIIGCLCLIGMLIFGMPYALVISVLVGFTALIPVFGAFIGTAIGAFLILLDSPLKALWFIVFIIVLQQLEGNLIYPRVVGKSVGLPGIWVLAAVTIGGGAFGILGMLLGVPVCAVLYALGQEFVRIRLKKSDKKRCGI